MFGFLKGLVEEDPPLPLVARPEALRPQPLAMGPGPQAPRAMQQPMSPPDEGPGLWDRLGAKFDDPEFRAGIGGAGQAILQASQPQFGAAAYANPLATAMAAAPGGYQAGVAGYQQGQAREADAALKQRLADLKAQGADLDRYKLLSEQAKTERGEAAKEEMLSVIDGMEGKTDAEKAILKSLVEDDPKAAAEALGMMPGKEAGPMSSYGKLLADADMYAEGDPRRDAILAQAEKLNAASGSGSGAGSEQPSTVREWEYFNGLSPEDQQRFLAMKRSQQAINLGDRYTVLDPLNPGQERASMEKGVSPDNAPALKAEQEAAKVIGKGQAESQRGLGQREADANYMLDLLGKAIEHPGMDGIVGYPSFAGMAADNFTGINFAPGSDESGFLRVMDQIQGKAFLEAFESLKGAGHITEVEGQKATQSIGRLSTAQSPVEFVSALKELQGIIRSGMERSRSSAAQSPSLPSFQAPGSSGSVDYKSKYGLE